MTIACPQIPTPECLRVFTRFPQTVKVFFGGAHDNGYTSTLTLLQNEGLLDKVILLKGYKDLAHEINGLGLPQLEIEGVFIQKKLHTNGAKKASAAAAAASVTAAVSSLALGIPKTNSPKPKTPAVQPQENEKGRTAKSSTGSASVSAPSTPAKKTRPLDPDQVRSTFHLLVHHMLMLLTYSLFTSVCPSPGFDDHWLTLLQRNPHRATSST